MELSPAAPAGPLRFAGYAALFDRRDGGRDVIRAGAFGRSLSARQRPLPLYWQHRPDQRIGWVERASEDARGLRVIAAIDNPAGFAATALRRGAVTGLSFGYVARGFQADGAGRELTEIDLFEVSLVTHPMQPGARVHLVQPPPGPHSAAPDLMKGDCPMEQAQTADCARDQDAALETSFDLVARQDAAEAALTTLRGALAEVKSQVERLGRHPARPVLTGVDPDRPREVKSFVDGYLRRGHEAELKAMSQGSLGDGGYAVPRAIDEAIAAVLKKISPIRSVAQVVQTGTSGYRKLIMTSGAASGWTSETGARPETISPKFMEVVPPYGELYANPSATQAMLDDAVFDLEGWLADELGREFARAEGAAFVNGSGTNQPKGFLQAPAAAQNDAVRPYGTLQFLVSGNASGFDAAPDLKLLDLVHSLKAGHRQGAVFIMNSATLGTLRKLKGTDGQYLYQNSLVDGHPVRLLGYPVVEAEDMPDIGAGAVPIAFGNFANGYLITERSTTTILRDPYTNKPFVNFYATKRIGGQVLDTDAIKLFKISA